MSVNVDNINATIARIRENQNFKFNMRHWGESADDQVIKDGHSCGTSACLAGFATLASGLAQVTTREVEIYLDNKGFVTVEADFIDFNNIVLKTPTADPSDAKVMQVGQTYLGITHEQATELFIPDLDSVWEDGNFYRAPDYWRATEDQAIAVLEHLRDTGKVDWSVSGIEGSPGYFDALANQIKRDKEELDEENALHT